MSCFWRDKEETREPTNPGWVHKLTNLSFVKAMPRKLQHFQFCSALKCGVLHLLAVVVMGLNQDLLQSGLIHYVGDGGVGGNKSGDQEVHERASQHQSLGCQVIRQARDQKHS
jgi:hypothetical protein